MVESLGRDMVTTVYLYFGSQSGLSQRHDAALIFRVSQLSHLRCPISHDIPSL